LAGRPRSARLGLLVLAALLLWGALSLYNRQQGPTGGWLRAAGLEERWADVDGLRLRYVRAGQGPPVVLLHGFSSSIFTWRHVLKALAREHDVLALDFPGFGGSQVPEQLSPLGLAGSVRTLVTQLGLRRPALVGHSMGGAVALLLAADPELGVSRLALLDAATFAMAAEDRPGLVRLVGRPWVAALLEYLPLRRLSVYAGLREVFYDDSLVTTEVLDEYVAPLRRPGTTRALARLLASGDAEARQLPERLAAVRVPTLVVWGRDDVWIPVTHAERHARTLPGTRVVLLKRCGHMPQEEQPQETLRLLSEFLRDGAASPAPD